MLSPSTIFNTASIVPDQYELAALFGRSHLSYGSQIFAIMWKQFVTPVIGLAARWQSSAACAATRHMGNFYLDMWRGVICLFLPLSLIVGTLLDGRRHTDDADGQRESGRQSRLNRWAKRRWHRKAAGNRTAAQSPRWWRSNSSARMAAASLGPNSAHPFENPIVLDELRREHQHYPGPHAVLIMFGRMIRNMRHAGIIFGVSLLMLGILTGWGIYSRHDEAEPRPARRTGRSSTLPGKPFQVSTLDSRWQGRR